MKTLILFLTLVSALSAETFYVAQTALGSGSGADASNTKAVSWFNTAANWGGGAGEIDPGDTVRLVGTITTQLVVQLSGSSGNLISILFEPGAKLSKPFWGVDSGAAIYANGKSYILIDGVDVGIVECTANGDALANQQQATGIFLSACSNIEIKRLTIRNIFIHTYGVNNPAGVGTYTTQCVKSSNGNSINVHHCILNNAYLGVYFYTETAVTITGNRAENNVLSACSTALVAACGASGSAINNTYLSGNDITMGLNWYDVPNDNHIDGIHTWTGSSGAGSMSGLYIGGNYIHGDPSPHCTGHIFVTDNVPSTYIFNNLCDGDHAGTNHPGEGYINFNFYAGSEAWVLSNTIRGNSADTNGGNALSHDPGNSSSTIHAKDNIFINNTMGFYQGGAWTTFDFAKNCYWANGDFGKSGSTYYTTLAAWVAFNGETGSISANPGFDSSLRFTSASPCYLTGEDVRSLVPGGLLGYYRDGTARPAGAMSMGSEPLQGGAVAPTITATAITAVTITIAP